MPDILNGMISRVILDMAINTSCVNEIQVREYETVSLRKQSFCWIKYPELDELACTLRSGSLLEILRMAGIFN